MEDIKTVGELIKIILAQPEQELVIGPVRISCEKEDADIDFKVKHHLMAWISGGQNKDTLLKDLEGIVSVDLEQMDELKKKNRLLTENAEEAEKKFSANALAIGKVEAYEKLLVGRKVTIEA